MGEGGPLPQSIETWNRIFDRCAGTEESAATHMPRAVGVFIEACRNEGSALGRQVAADLEVRLAVSRKLGFKRWTSLPARPVSP